MNEGRNAAEGGGGDLGREGAVVREGGMPQGERGPQVASFKLTTVQVA